MKENILLHEGSTVDAYIVYKFLRKLTTPFAKMDAYKLGIIDDKGKILRKRATFNKEAEFQAYTLLDRVVINLKKLIAKIPNGSSQFASYAAALWLLKEANNYEEFLSDGDLMYESYSDFLMLASGQSKEIVSLFEDAPTVNVGSGQIAGTGHDGNDPLVTKKNQKKLIRRNSFTDFVEEEEEDEDDKKKDITDS